jgi:MSHA biogenesis protein MshQ
MAFCYPSYRSERYWAYKSVNLTSRTVEHIGQPECAEQRSRMIANLRATEMIFILAGLLVFSGGAYAATVTTATGGGAIASNTAPSCSAAGTWYTLTGPVLTETAAANIGLGSIVLTAPSGFEFDSTANVTILLTGNSTASRNINNVATGTSMAVNSISSTAITFTVTEVSTRTNTLTWQGIKVRPTASTSTSGNIIHTGTSTISGVTTNSTNFGTLTEVISSPVCNEPSVTTNAATSITTSGATLNGTVSSNGANTAVTFDYGLTTSYGGSPPATATPSTILAGTSSAVSSVLTGLTCNTTYHFRVSGVSSLGTTNGNDLTFSTAACPAVTSINTANANPTNAASVSWTVTFNTSVTGVSSSNFTLVNSGLGGTPAITGVTGSGTTWTVTASTGTGNGTLGLDMANVTGISPAVTPTTFTGQVYTIDRVAPVVSSIALADSTPTALSSVSWNVTFSKSVTGVNAADFTLVQADGVSGAAITAVTGSGTAWTVTANTGTGDGTLGLNLVDDDSIIDASSNPLGGTGAGNGDFSGEVYTVARPNSPTVCTDDSSIGTKTWSTLTGPVTSDNAYATATVTDGQTTHYLKCTGYGFAIPSNAVIEGITVGVERFANNTNLQDAAVRIVKGGGIGTTDRSNAGLYPTADPNTYDDHGGVNDLWGETWTPADINSANFGVAIASRKSSTAGNNRTISIDHINISVAYRLSMNCTSNTSGNWSLSSTWTNCRGGIPLAGDNVTIANAHNVTLNVDTPALNTLTVNSGGILTNTGSNTITLSGGMSNAGTYTGGSGAVTVAGDFANTGSYSAGSATTTLSGNFSNSGTFTADSGTWSFSGSSAQSLSGVTVFNNLTLNNTAGLTLNNDITVSDTLTLTSGTFSVGANLLTLNGSTIAGTPTNLSTSSSSSLSFGGNSSGVTVPGSVTVLNNLTVNNVNGISLGGSSVTTTLSGALTLDANNLTTGTNTLILAGDCTANSGSGSLSRTGGYVIGNLKLTFPVGISSCTYHVGDSIGYSPITVAMTVIGAGTLSGRVDASDHADTTGSASGIDSTKSANHYWTLTAGTVAYSSYSATFQFCANTGSCSSTEVDSGVNTSNFIVALKSSGIWTSQTAGIRNNYSTQATGITGLGEFAVGELSTNNCYTEAFTGTDGASPGTNWSVGYKTGTFGSPVIFGNRLRLTNNSTSVATWATLQKLFPAAGNKITVEFDFFAYDGTGSADGIAVVLSDASVAPQAGAFGGSLGYAQKSNPGSDCTTTGGCPGFSGGWLGVALDEYGNYSTNTEGRFGGSTSRIQNSVAVRGSGSGMSGYRFLLGTSTLTPVIDGNNTANPPHRYRIIVDHTDSVHAWASVERDTTGGGTAYTTLIGCPPGVTSGCTAFDVKDPGNSQDAVPSYWNLSFTGSTGSSTNIHEIDSLKVCTVQGLATPTLHHIRIEHGGTACTSNASTVTVKACADAACEALYMGSVTVNLSTTGGTWSPVSPITFSGGQTTVTLTDTSARSDTLGATATSPTASNATQCYNGTTQTCVLTFAACTFDVIEVGAAVNTPIYTKLANTAFSLDVLSRSGASQTVTAIELVDMSSGTCSSPAGTLSPVTLSPALTTSGVPSFSANQRKTFSFTYSNAAPNVRVRVTSAGPLYSCSSDNFAIRPQSFNLASNATQSGSSGTPAFRAGTDPFWLSATAVYSTTTTNSYTGTPKLNLASGMMTTALLHLGTLGSATFSPAVSGVATASGLTYSEVGNFSLAQYAVYDDSFAEVDSVKSECTSGFSNTLSNSRYSCQFGSGSPITFGRFVPDHFRVAGTLTNACSAGAFTYMGQPFSLSIANVVTAENAANSVTQNYTGSYAHGTTSFGAENADNGTDLTSRLTFSTGSWSNGTFTLTSASGTFTRPTTATSDATWGAFESLDIGLTVNDSDVTTSPQVSGADMNPGAAGGTNNLYKKFSGSPLRMRLGRLNLQNAYGSELLALPMSLTAEYWGGSYWLTNTDDSCTALTAPAFGSGLSLNLADNGLTTATLNNPLVSGNANLILSAPGATHTGYVDVTINIDSSFPWLQFDWKGTPSDATDDNPTARGTFGIYKGNSKFIYIRELY